MHEKKFISSWFVIVSDDVQVKWNCKWIFVVPMKLEGISGWSVKRLKGIKLVNCQWMINAFFWMINVNEWFLRIWGTWKFNLHTQIVTFYMGRLIAWLDKSHKKLTLRKSTRNQKMITKLTSNILFVPLKTQKQLLNSATHLIKPNMHCMQDEATFRLSQYYSLPHSWMLFESWNYVCYL